MFGRSFSLGTEQSFNISDEAQVMHPLGNRRSPKSAFNALRKSLSGKFTSGGAALLFLADARLLDANVGREQDP